MANDKQMSERRKLPITRSEDVEFSMEQADEDDLEAMERMEAADKRQEND
ncbi:YfhD family protein [Gorillibacterium sp. sgz5001074]